MVVTPPRPSIGIVTIAALRTETSIMFVLMAFLACYGLILVDRGPVTFLTRH